MKFSWTESAVVVLILAVLVPLACCSVEAHGSGTAELSVIFDPPPPPGSRVLMKHLWDRTDLGLAIEESDSSWGWREVPYAGEHLPAPATVPQNSHSRGCSRPTIYRPQLMLFVAESASGQRSYAHADVPKHGENPVVIVSFAEAR